MRSTCLANAPVAANRFARSAMAARRHAGLVDLVPHPWLLRVERTTLTIRPVHPRELSAVAAMHSRCSPRTLLDRFRTGGKGPSVLAMDQMVRSSLSFVAATSRGEIVAMAVAEPDRLHSGDAADVGVLVEDKWQGKGIGRELLSHLAGAALVHGYSELITYTATSAADAQRLLLEIGATRVVNDRQRPHLHTYLPESAALGLGAVRERLAS
ncbi:L-amino acid N-acyltransferase YncA [Frankineae bacterium MT45]|nr:L-amino acid N-acyltransferase YncA [Frankineae bacterium MT45]